MSGVIKTYRMTGAFGIASMAMGLAELRLCRRQECFDGFWTRYRISPVDRCALHPAIHPVSVEYYAIIDRITRGEKP